MIKFWFLGGNDVVHDVIAEEKNHKISNFLLFSPNLFGDRYPNHFYPFALLVLAKIVDLMIKFWFLGGNDVIYDVIAEEKMTKISIFLYIFS